MVAAKDRGMFGTGIADQVEVLVNCISSASVPVLTESHLSGDGLNVLPEAERFQHLFMC